MHLPLTTCIKGMLLPSNGLTSLAKKKDFNDLVASKTLPQGIYNPRYHAATHLSKITGTLQPYSALTHCHRRKPLRPSKRIHLRGPALICRPFAKPSLASCGCEIFKLMRMEIHHDQGRTSRIKYLRPSLARCWTALIYAIYNHRIKLVCGIKTAVSMQLALEPSCLYEERP